MITVLFFPVLSMIISSFSIKTMKTKHISELKGLLSILLLMGLTTSAFASGTCYFSLGETGKINAKAANAVSLSLLSRYFKPLRDLPPEGVSSDVCVYYGKVARENGKIVVMISGKDLNLYGNSKNKGFDGYEEAFLDALVKQYPAKKQEICSVYPCTKPRQPTQKKQEPELSREQQVLDNSGS